MDDMQPRPPYRILFEPFLRELKKELGYPIDIGKLRQLIAWAEGFEWQEAGMYFNRLYAVCKLLFLQDERNDEARFNGLFRQYVLDELRWWVAVQETTILPALETPQPSGNQPALPPNPTTEAGDDEEKLPPKSAEEISEKEPPDEEVSSQPSKQAKFLNLYAKSKEEKDSDETNAPNSHYLFTDAYMPLTYREMAHGWRYLRQRDDFRPSNRLDVEATVLHVAKEGLMLNPVFQQEALNSEDLLVIFADRRGSMVPFHYLTDRLIEAALKEGGHRKAQVYYFYNCPAGHVYRNPNLTDPMPLGEVYAKIRHDRTNALVISDAGAARGNLNELRVQKTIEFLDGTTDGEETTTYKGLQKQALFVAWLNPMPRHRWGGTTAGAIHLQSPTRMIPLMELGREGLLQAVHTLMGKQ